MEQFDGRLRRDHGQRDDDAGTGTLQIDSGNTLTSKTGYLGYLSGSSGSITLVGSGTAWTNRDQLYVGYSGDGTLNVGGGSAVTGSISNAFGRQYLGYQNGSTGVARIDGSDTTWTCGQVCVGYLGSGTLSVTGGSPS